MGTRRTVLFVTTLTLTVMASACRTGSALLRAPAEPVQSHLASDVAWLASDALEGRATGTAGNDSARVWLIRRMRELGLDPVVRDPGCTSCPPRFDQPFDARMSGAERNGLPTSMPTANVIGVIRGSDPALRGQYVLIGAHYDHLGRRTFGARDPEAKDAIRNGADDNASGTATVLELARLLRKNPPKRSVAVLAFSAEELGLLGAEYLANQAPFPLDSVQAMLNFDMVGRLTNDRLMVYGTATATELPDVVRAHNTAPAFALNAIGDGEGPSDHAAFYRKNLPVLHFFTDVHDDYHKATDDADRLNVEGMVRVVAYAERIVRTLADRPTRLTFTRAPQTAVRTGSPARSGGPRPSLGTVPDIGAGDVKGLRLSSITPGSPAEKAGIRAGDVVVELAGLAVTDLQSYSDALYSKKPGDEITVVVQRGTERLTFTVTLVQRGG